jgi:hypothetical protein
MKRELHFTQSKGKLADALGLDRDRLAEIEKQVNQLIKQDASLKTILETMNERGDLTDAEWTNLCYTLGWFTSKVDEGYLINVP